MNKERKKDILKKILTILIIIIIFLIISKVVKLVIGSRIEGKLLISDNKEIKIYNFDPSKSLDIYRIVILGGSVVRLGCPGAKELEKKLNENLKKLNIGRKKRINVINAGEPSSHILKLSDNLEIIKDNMKIDMLLVLTGWNEHWYNPFNNPCVRANCYDDIELGRLLLNYSKNKNRIIKYFSSRGVEYWLAKNSEKCQKVLKQNPKEFIKDINHYNTSIYRVDLNTYEKELIKIIENARKEGTKIIIVTPPDYLEKGQLPFVSLYDCTLLDKDAYFNVHHLYVNKSKEIAEKLFVQLIDLDAIFQKMYDDKEYKYYIEPSFDPIHPSKEGNALCTNMTYQKISLILS